MVEKRRGFTLLELLTVMVIIAVLSGLGAGGYSLARRQAKESRAKVDLEKWRAALNEYRVELGSYPAQNPGAPIRSVSAIGFLTNAVEGVESIDPWGNAYQYQCTNRFAYRIWSEGQDTETDDDNIDPSKTGY